MIWFDHDDRPAAICPALGPGYRWAGMSAEDIEEHYAHLPKVKATEVRPGQTFMNDGRLYLRIIGGCILFCDCDGPAFLTEETMKDWHSSCVIDDHVVSLVAGPPKAMATFMRWAYNWDEKSRATYAPDS